MVTGFVCCLRVSLYISIIMQTKLKKMTNRNIFSYPNFTARRRPYDNNECSTVRRLWQQNSRKVVITRVRSLLAQQLPKVHVVRRCFSGNWQLVLRQKQHDPVQERLYEVRNNYII